MYKLTELLADVTPNHSVFQMDHFITKRTGGTAYGQYKQALRELQSRYDNVRNSCSGHKKFDIDIEEMEYKMEKLKQGIEEAPDPKPLEFELRRIEIDYQQQMATKITRKNDWESQVREFVRCYQQCCILKDKVGELTEERLMALEEEMFSFKMLEMAALELITVRSVSINTLETILAFTPENRKNCLDKIKEPAELLKWVEEKNDEIIPVDLPVLKASDFEEVTSFIETHSSPDRLMLPSKKENE